MKSELLIIEDHALLRYGMKSMIERIAPQYQVQEASSYAGAIMKISGIKFDIILIDIDLGEENSGIDILHYLQSNEIACRRIMISGHEDSKTIRTCLALGASGYIIKSVHFEHIFKHAIDCTLKGSVYLPPLLGREHKININQSFRTSNIASQIKLSSHQSEVLHYLFQGMTNKAIAKRMRTTESTVQKQYVSDLLRVFGVKRRPELMIEISRRGLEIRPPASAM